MYFCTCIYIYKRVYFAKYFLKADININGPKFGYLAKKPKKEIMSRIEFWAVTLGLMAQNLFLTLLAFPPVGSLFI